LKEWRSILLRANKKFKVWSDHLNLIYYWKPQDLSGQQARWISNLQNYNFTLLHKAGKLKGKADLLS
jgi:hypothetical protein